MEVKISRDETNLENICVKNRPMNVAEEYQMFCSDAWLDAKSALDDFMDNPSKESEMERVALLHDILMVAQTVTSAILDDMLAQISAPLEQIDQPVLFFDKKAKQVKYEKHPKGGRKLQFQHFDNAVRDIIRGRADNVDCRQFLKLAYAELEEFHPEATDVIKAVHEVDTYIEKACGLAWKMAIQRPKLTFGTPGLGEPWMGDSLQEVWWGSDDPEDPSSKTVCYVHPILYHGDNVMAKGKVVLRKAESKGKAAGKGKGSREGKREHKVYDMDEPEEEHKIAEAAAKATPRSRKLKK